jgi:hypothetical protein
LKRAETGFSLLPFLVAAGILLSEAGFAQQPVEKGGSAAEGLTGDAKGTAATKVAATKVAATKVIESRAPGHPVRVNGSAASISILPAGIFAPMESASIESTPIEPRRRAGNRFVAGRSSGAARDSDLAGLAKELRNPVSSLARIPSRHSYDILLAADREGWRYSVDFEPTFPIRVNNDWSVISRTTLPFIQQDGIVRSTTQTGLGDVIQRFLLSPNNTEPVFWGVGTAFLFPTATDTRLGAGKLGLGPSLAIGRQQRAWTYGFLAHHIWSVAGHSDRADVNATYVQPFLAYTTKSAWTYSIDAEANLDWEGRQWSVPIHIEIAKVLRLGPQPISVAAALRCWASSPSGGPQACGVRFMVTPLFPAR